MRAFALRTDEPTQEPTSAVINVNTNDSCSIREYQSVYKWRAGFSVAAVRKPWLRVRTGRVRPRSGPEARVHEAREIESQWPAYNLRL
jgi:hypothetical protein